MAAAEVVAILRANTSEFTAKLDEAEAKIKKLGNSGSSNMEKLSTIGKAALLGIGGAALGVGIASVDMADKYQATTDRIAASAGISTTAANNIGKAFLTTAGTTIYSAQQMATAYAGVAGQLGATQGHALSAKQALDVMKTSGDLAEATGSSLGEATQALSLTLQTFGLKAANAASASNVLYNTARMTGNGLGQLSTTFATLHAKLGAVSPPLGQFGGLLVDLANHGETGRRALMMLNTAMTTLLKPTEAVGAAQNNLTAIVKSLPPNLQALAQQYQAGTLTSKQLSSATKGLSIDQRTLFTQFTSAYTAVDSANSKLTELGVTVTNSHGKFVGMGSVIGQLHNKIQGMTQAQQLATVAQAFGAKGAQALLGVIQSGSGAYDKLTASVTKADSAHAAAEKQSQTLQHQIETLKATVQDYGVKIGQALIPKLETLMHVVASVVTWFTKHKAIAEALAVVIGGALATAIGVYVVNTGTKMVESTMKAARSLGLLSTEVEGVKVEGMASKFASGFASIASSTAKWVAENVAKIATVVATNVAGAASAAAAWIAANIAMIAATAGIALAVGVLILAVVEIVKHWHGIVTFFKKVWTDVKHWFMEGIDFVKGLLLNFTPEGLIISHWSQIVSFFQNLWNMVKTGVITGWNDIVSFFQTVPAKILAALAGAATWLVGIGKDILKGLWDGVKAGWSALGDIASTIWNWWKTAITNQMQWLYSIGKDVITGLWNGLRDGFQALGSVEMRIWNWFLRAVTNALDWLHNIGMDVLTGLWNGLTDAWSALGNIGSTIAGWFTSGLSGAVNWLKNIGGDVIHGLAEGIVAAASATLGNIPFGIGTALVNAFKSALGVNSPSVIFHGIGVNLMEGLANGMKAGASSPLGALAGISGQIAGQSFGASLGANSGVSPAFASSGAAAGGSSQPVILQVEMMVDGQQFATVTQRALLQYQRGAGPILVPNAA